MKKEGSGLIYNDTITIFNRKKGQEGDVWYPTVIEGVQLSVERVQAAAGYGWKQTGETVALIPYVPLDGALTVKGKIYLPPKVWQKADEPELYVTFAQGEDFDFFVPGAWPEDEPVTDGTWPEGFYEHLCRERDGVWAVGSVHRYGALPHFEIVGR